MTLYSMFITMLLDPGTLDAEYYKYFHLTNNIMKDSKKQGISKNKNDDSTLNIPITNSSFEKLFIQDLEQNETSPNNDKEINYYNTREFLFKFLFYTRDLTFENIKQNRIQCYACLFLRPERTHHCKECNKCILKMDHHCDILNTCIGLYNYKPWMIFVFYTCLTLIFLVCTMIDGIHFYLDQTYYGWQTLDAKLFLVYFVITTLSLIPVGDLFITHLIYIAKGTTTKEHDGKICDNIIFDSSTQSNINNKGFFFNMKEIFGVNICSWLWPSTKHFHPFEGYIWPKDGNNYVDYIIKERMNYINELKKHFNIENENQDESADFEGSFQNNSNSDSLIDPI
jgi:hypothetical protein